MGQCKASDCAERRASSPLLLLLVYNLIHGGLDTAILKFVARAESSLGFYLSAVQQQRRSVFAENCFHNELGYGKQAGTIDSRSKGLEEVGISS